MTLNETSYLIIGKAIEIHKILEPGLLESTYQKCLLYELTKAGLIVEKEKVLPIVYKGIEFEQGYRIDLLVNKQIVIELKCVEQILPVHIAQTLSYVKLGKYRLGLLINFHSKVLKQGIKRLIY